MFENIFCGGVLLLILSNPVLTWSEFYVHRMSQFDVNGVYFGCRSSALSLEARSLYTWGTSRHCVVTKFEEMTVDEFREIRQKAGGLVILLPRNVSNMNTEEKERLLFLEQAVMEQSVTIPVYFSKYNTELEDIISDITNTASDKYSGSYNKKVRDSALSEIFNSISANGYQIIVTGANNANNKNSKIPIIQGELTPLKAIKFPDGVSEPTNNKLPMIIVTAALNTFGMYNDYPLNADSAVLMTLADMFSKLQNSSNAASKHRIIFLLSESGPLLNYQGVKKWLDENVQLQNVEFVLCLDSITQPFNNIDGQIYMHVSRPPKENTPISTFFKHLKSVANKFSNITAEGVHKKINLAETQLAWLHERFSLKRLPSFSLSSLKLPKHPSRISVFKDTEEVVLKQTQRNAKIIAEALARYMYSNNDLEETDIFSGRMEISSDVIKSYINLKSALQTNDIKNIFDRYLKNVVVLYEKPDVRDPDFMLYEGSDAVLNVYRVKPAVFDLILTIIICSYLCCVYFGIKIFPNIYGAVCKIPLKPQGLSPVHSNHMDKMKIK